MKSTLKQLFILFILSSAYSLNYAQETVNILIISDEIEDNQNINNQFEGLLEEEIKTLLQARYDLRFTTVFAGYDLSGIIKSFESAFVDDAVDIIIASGPMSSNVLAQWSSYAKPAIATLILDSDLQSIRMTAEQSSGVKNFTYIQSPFDVKRDLETLRQIYPYKELGVIGVEESVRYFPTLDLLFERLLGEIVAGYSFIAAQPSTEATLNSIPEKIDALYVLPLFNIYSLDQQNELIKGISNKKIPSAGLLGEELVEPGILMGYEANNNFRRIPRRVALNISKILEGQNVSDLPVIIPTYNENLLINMATAARIGIYPSWEMMAEATLLKVDEVETDNKWTLRSTILEALQNNLALQIAQKDPLIAEKDVALAKAEYFPTVEANSSLALIDETTTFSAQGTRGQLSWLASGDLTQLVFSEPALANIAIQKMLQKGQEAALEQTQLDVILDVAEAYFGVLQAHSGVRIQNENVNVTKRNLDIAKAKLAVGYSGVTDINRWESELALSNIDLNNAQASLRQSRLNFNQLLNRPIDEDFELEEVSLEAQKILFIMDGRMLPLINNPGDLEHFADFLVEEAFRQLPEIRQLDHNINAQNRQLLSQKRAFTLPSVALSGSVDYLIDTWKYPEGLMPKDANTSWSLGLGLQYPILQGGKRKITVDQNKLVLLQLEDQKKNLLNQLEFLVRANLATVGASYSSTVLSKAAADAARKNFGIVQDSYSLGQVNVTTLIDAQNTALQTELAAVNANYQFIIDFLTLERSIGRYYFLMESAEVDAYFQRLTTFLNENK